MPLNRVQAARMAQAEARLRERRARQQRKAERRALQHAWAPLPRAAAPASQQKLPAEVLLHVARALAQVGTARDVAAARLVCRRWNAVFGDPSVLTAERKPPRYPYPIVDLGQFDRYLYCPWPATNQEDSVIIAAI